MRDTEQAKMRLLSGEYTCVLCRAEEEQVFTERGVRPLVMCLQSGNDYRGYAAADKVVGKATAFLYVMMGVRSVFARVISESALAVLRRHGVAVEFETCTPYIINRQGNGMCPFEQAVYEIDDPAIAYQTVCRKLHEMNHSAL